MAEEQCRLGRRETRVDHCRRLQWGNWRSLALFSVLVVLMSRIGEGHIHTAPEYFTSSSLSLPYVNHRYPSLAPPSFSSSLSSFLYSLLPEAVRSNEGSKDSPPAEGFSSRALSSCSVDSTTSSTPPSSSFQFYPSGVSSSSSSSIPSFASFSSSIAASFSLTTITEFGDRTFFIAAILSLKYSQWIVFLGAWLALILMTFVSTFIGQLLHFLPTSLKSLSSLALDDWAAALLLLIFSVTHFYYGSTCSAGHESSSTSPSPSTRRNSQIEEKEGDLYYSLSASGPDVAPISASADSHTMDKQKTTDVSSTASLPSMGSTDSPLSSSSSSFDSTTSSSSSCSSSFLSPPAVAAPERVKRHRHSVSLSSVTGPPIPHGETAADGSPRVDPLLAKAEAEGAEGEEYEEAKEAVERIQYHRLGVRPGGWSVIRESFLVVLVAEIGDKSMVSTIALAAAQNPYGVIIGGCAAHAVVTLVAILCGALLHRYISERIANFTAGFLFLIFGLLTLLQALKAPTHPAPLHAPMADRLPGHTAVRALSSGANTMVARLVTFATAMVGGGVADNLAGEARRAMGR